MTVTRDPNLTAAHSMSRSEVIDAVARVVARQGPGALRWAAIVKEAGSPSVSQAWEWYPDLQALLDECYSRTAQGIEESLLVGETAPATRWRSSRPSWSRRSTSDASAARSCLSA